MGEYRKYDGELDLAFSRIAQTRKQMEEAGFTYGLLDLSRRLFIARETVLRSIDRSKEQPEKPL